MIRILEEKPVPRATVTCNSCGSLLEYGNGDLYEDFSEKSNYSIIANRYAVKDYYFSCPVCGVKVKVSWINK